MGFEEPRLFVTLWWGVSEPYEQSTGMRAALDKMDVKNGNSADTYERCLVLRPVKKDRTK